MRFGVRRVWVSKTHSPSARKQTAENARSAFQRSVPESIAGRLSAAVALRRRTTPRASVRAPAHATLETPVGAFGPSASTPHSRTHVHGRADETRRLVEIAAGDDCQAGVAEEGEEGPTVPEKLSKRQKQLLVMLDKGLSNRDIADALSISEHTVKVHLWRLFRRLNVKSRSQASHLARTAGLIDF